MRGYSAVRKRHRQHGPPEEGPDGTVPLSALRVGNDAVVRDLRVDDKAVARKLLALGVVPGAQVKLIQRFPTYVIMVGLTLIAIDKQLAKAVRVEPVSES